MEKLIEGKLVMLRFIRVRIPPQQELIPHP